MDLTDRRSQTKLKLSTQGTLLPERTEYISIISLKATTLTTRKLKPPREIKAGNREICINSEAQVESVST